MDLPETGFLRLRQIIGQVAISEQEAAFNRARGKGPRRPRPFIPALVPLGKSTWWAGVRSGRFPAPSYDLGRGLTVWRVEQIREFLRANEKIG